MKFSQRLILPLASALLFSTLCNYMWKHSFFLKSYDSSLSLDESLKEEEVKKHVYAQLDYLRNLSTSPSYLFKYNLAKIDYLLTETKPTVTSLVGFKTWMDDARFDDVLTTALDDKIINTSDAVMLAKMSIAIEGGDIMLTSIKELTTEMDRFAFVKHIVGSYFRLMDEGSTEALLSAPTNSDCVKCIQVCTNKYSFSSLWWDNYKKMLKDKDVGLRNDKDFHHAYFFAVTQGVQECENTVCATSCTDPCTDCVPSFVYEKV